MSALKTRIAMLEKLVAQTIESAMPAVLVCHVPVNPTNEQRMGAFHSACNEIGIEPDQVNQFRLAVVYLTHYGVEPNGSITL